MSQQTQQAFSVSAADSIVLDSLQDVCQTYLDTLQGLDSLLATGYNNTTATTRNSIAQQYQQAKVQQQTYLDNLHQQQQTAVSPICNANSSFSTNVLHEQLEQQVNTIYLNTIARGIMNFQTQQLSTLQLIASYCPQEGGVAIHHARSMLALVEPVNFVDFDCVTENYKPVQQEEENVNADWEVILYPNPTDDVLNISSNHSLESNVSVSIYNSLGQQVNVSLSEINTINTSLLTDGIYTIKITQGENVIIKPFIVSHK